MRRVALVVACGLLVGLGCGLALARATRSHPAPVLARPATIPAVPAAPGVGAVQAQVANGPVLGGPAPEPLAVKLGVATDPVRAGLGRLPRSGLLFDLDTGEVLWRHDPTRVLPIASVTKVMTAILVAQRTAPGARAKITKEALAYKGSGVGVLPKGKRVGVQALLYGLLLPSGNDAAIALAQRVSGTVARFVDLMNARAAAMHLSCTRFASPSGIDDRGHSCAYDLAALARAFLDTPRVARIVLHQQVTLPFPIKGGKLFLAGHDPLVETRYPGALGIKTGFTDKAGRCFLGAARRGGRTLGVVLLHSVDPGRQARRLLDRGFAYERAKGRLHSR